MRGCNPGQRTGLNIKDLWFAFFKKFGLVGGFFFFMVFQAEVLAGGFCDFAAAFGSADKANLQKIRLDHILQRTF
jgi:hypothetical protein